MIRTLYKRSHILASAILGTAMLTGLALAEIPRAHATAPMVSTTAKPELIGRFVVGPQSSSFVPANAAGE